MRWTSQCACAHFYYARISSTPAREHRTKYMNAKTCSSTIAATATTVTTNTRTASVQLPSVCSTAAVRLPHECAQTLTQARDSICRLWIFGKTLFGCRSRSETARITSVASHVSVSVGDSISMEPNRWRIFSSCLVHFSLLIFTHKSLAVCVRLV